MADQQPLKMQDLVDIRRKLDEGKSVSWIARRFGVTYDRVYGIKTRRHFKNVPWPERDGATNDER
jgi:hypothetical protein